MSNVIAFRRPERQQPAPDVQEAITALLSTDAIIATILLEGIDDMPRALDKAAQVLSTIPPGGARDFAERELARFRAALAAPVT